MVFIHVIRERPSGLQQFPAREAVKICFASVSSGIHAMCPNRDRRLDWTIAERWGCLVNLLTAPAIDNRIGDTVVWVTRRDKQKQNNEI